MKKTIGIGADIGGSHISCAAVDLAAGTIIRESLSGLKVDTNAPFDTVLDGWAQALGSAMSAFPAETIKGVGFAMPGPFVYLKGVVYIKEHAKF